MKEIHSIVVPVDFLELTRQLVEYALYIGRSFNNASLKFIHVVGIPYTMANVEYPSLVSYTAEVEEHARKEMAQLLEGVKEKNYLDCTGTVQQGNIVESIIDYAQKIDADLIVIGTHGRKGLKKLWLGSVAERVIRQTPCPILTCRPYE